MILKCINHNFEYGLIKICTAFFPNEKIKSDGNDNILITTSINESELFVAVKVYDKSLSKSTVLGSMDMAENAMSVLLYNTLCEMFDCTLPWGFLYGVRPVKRLRHMSKKYGEEKAVDLLKKTFLVSDEKAQLTREVLNRENKIISLSKDNSFSLYVSIPFCPTRCTYCSFVSHSIERTKKLVKPYVDLLVQEIVTTGKIAKRLGLRLETIYFGGGTPTTLSSQDLTKLLCAIEENFDLSNLREYTVEAGRPDTVTREKLIALKNANADRISINPQTFNGDVLKTIGRQHTPQQTVDAYILAQECGFKNINMDLIAGLPSDDFNSFKNSVDYAILLDPASITIHTLCLKSSSYLVTRDETFDMSAGLEATEMIDYSQNKLRQSGYYPYYMYRQAKSVGNLENVGWCKRGKDCLYNVYMMDETHSVFALGAGAVTRLINPVTKKIERIYNYKYPYEYIDKFDEILNRKEKIENFFK